MGRNDVDATGKLNLGRACVRRQRSENEKLGDWPTNSAGQSGQAQVARGLLCERVTSGLIVDGKKRELGFVAASSRGLGSQSGRLMEINDILGQMGGLRSIAQELGVSESQAATGAAALLPAILGGFKKQAQAQPSGLEGLGGMLGQLGGGSLLDDVLSPQPTNVNRGNDVLGQIFGSKDVSRTVAQSASAKTGLDTGLLKKMLPMVAMLVAGYMAKQRITGGQAAAESTSGGLGGLLGGLFGGQATGGTGSGFGSMLDMNKDGNPLDDILRMAGKALG
jgi:hypothetical protein